MSFLASTLSTSTSLARGLSTSARASAPIKEFVVIGGGLMGAGIAQVMFDLDHPSCICLIKLYVNSFNWDHCLKQVGAQTGHTVTLVDISEEVLNKSKARIGKSMAQVAKKKFKEDPAKGDEFIKEAMNRFVF